MQSIMSDKIITRVIMFYLKKMFLPRLVGVTVLGFAMGFSYNNIANSNQMTGDGSSKHNQPVANMAADSEISFFCVRDDDLIEVSMARSMARKRNGSWYLPGYDECF